MFSHTKTSRLLPIKGMLGVWKKFSFGFSFVLICLDSVLSLFVRIWLCLYLFGFGNVFICSDLFVLCWPWFVMLWYVYFIVYWIGGYNVNKNKYSLYYQLISVHSSTFSRPLGTHSQRERCDTVSQWLTPCYLPYFWILWASMSLTDPSVILQPPITNSFCCTLTNSFLSSDGVVFIPIFIFEHIWIFIGGMGVFLVFL